MTSANWDSTDLVSVAEGGWVNEDVLQQIFDISRIPLPLADLIGSESSENEEKSWLTDQLVAPALGGWVVDGADAGADESQGGARISNHHGILDKVVKVSTRARNVDTIGGEALAYQIRQRQRELRQDVDANALGNQGSQISDANAATPGIPASLPVMMTKHATGGGGSGGVYGTGVWTDWTPGTKAALTETMLRDASQAAYEDGGNPTHLMSVPAIIRLLSEYMFTASSRIATLVGETNNDGPAKAMGSVNRFLTDFGSELQFIPNRLQQPYQSSGGAAGDAAAVMLIDPDYAAISYLHGYRIEPLAKTGLADNRQMAVDWTVICHEPNAHRALMDIDVAAAVVQA